jgi:hypothetical protein
VTREVMLLAACEGVGDGLTACVDGGCVIVVRCVSTDPPRFMRTITMQRVVSSCRAFDSSTAVVGWTLICLALSDVIRFVSLNGVDSRSIWIRFDSAATRRFTSRCNQRAPQRTKLNDQSRRQSMRHHQAHRPRHTTHDKRASTRDHTQRMQPRELRPVEPRDRCSSVFKAHSN